MVMRHKRKEADTIARDAEYWELEKLSNHNLAHTHLLTF